MNTKYYLDLLSITKAAITPGTHPQMVNNNVIKIEPHPWSITANGGKIMANITLKTLIYIRFYNYKSSLKRLKFHGFDQ